MIAYRVKNRYKKASPEVAPSQMINLIPSIQQAKTLCSLMMQVYTDKVYWYEKEEI